MVSVHFGAGVKVSRLRGELDICAGRHIRRTVCYRIMCNLSDDGSGGVARPRS